MLEQLKKEQNRTWTENGAAAYRSTGNACLDFFAVAGALRNAKEERIQDLLIRAFAENPDYALRTVFYARDIRGGLGERRLFYVALRILSEMEPESLLKNLDRIPEYGRYDDWLVLLNSPCEEAVADRIRKQLEQDIRAMEQEQPVSLLAKWLPSVNTSREERRVMAKRLCRLLCISEKKYRRTLSALRTRIDVLEKRLCLRDYSFDYSKQPSGAMLKYRKAFLRNDGIRYQEFIRQVLEEERSMHAGTLYPYEIVRACMSQPSGEERQGLNATWRSLPVMEDTRNALVVMDGSGSMYLSNNGIQPVTVAISLSLYFAQQNQGHFHNHFITFSEIPRLIRIPETDITSQVRCCMSYNEVANTDLYEVFMLLLITAVKHKLSQEELPEILYIISDMEFDCGVNPDETVFEDAREKFRDYGYQLPTVVYWNVNARGEQYPVERNEQGAVLVSGASPSVFRMMISQKLTPEAFMETVLDSERYRDIVA